MAQEGLKTNLLMCYKGVVVQEVLIISMLVQEGLLNSYKKFNKL